MGLEEPLCTQSSRPMLRHWCALPLDDGHFGRAKDKSRKPGMARQGTESRSAAAMEKRGHSRGTSLGRVERKGQGEGEGGGQ